MQTGLLRDHWLLRQGRSGNDRQISLDLGVFGSAEQGVLFCFSSI